MSHGHHHHKQHKDKGAEQDPKQDKEAGGGEKKQEEGAAEAAPADAAQAGAGDAAAGPKTVESWAPPTIDVTTPASGDTYDIKGQIAVNFEVGSEQTMKDKEKTQHVTAHFALHKDGKVIQTGEMDELLKEGHARDVFAFDASQFGGPGKVELHYWASDFKGVQSPIKKLQLEIVDESKPADAPAADAAQAADPNQPAAGG